MKNNQHEIRVVLLGATPPPNGGIASWTMRMLSSETLRGNNCKFFLVDEKLRDREVFTHTSKLNLISEFKRCGLIWKRLLRGLRNNYRIVHANIPAMPRSMAREIVSALITKLFNGKFIIHFRCTVPIACHGIVSSFLLNVLVFLSDSIIVLNEPSKTMIEKIAGKRRVFLIPNYISEAELPDISDCENGLRSVGRIRKVFYSGGMIESKGVLDIYKIASRLPDINFRLAGAGDLANCSSVPKNVTILGSLDRAQLTQEYLSADAFIFLTHFPGEGFSNSLVEAMSFALPCVVSDWAANREMIGVDGGVVIDCSDIEGAISGLLKLNNPEVRKQCGFRNRNKVTLEYSEEVCCSKYVSVYRGVLGH